MKSLFKVLPLLIIVACSDTTATMSTSVDPNRPRKVIREESQFMESCTARNFADSKNMMNICNKQFQDYYGYSFEDARASLKQRTKD